VVAVPITAHAGLDPGSLSIGQLFTLTRCATRELGWGLRAVQSEVAHWRALALTVPDPAVRHFAVNATTKRRSLVDGVALFWILPSRRRPGLVRLLVALQTLLNFLDDVLERGAQGPTGRPESWMGVAVDALDVGGARTSYPAADDGGFVGALIQTCREQCGLLPHYPTARKLLLREARRARAFEIEHDRDPSRRMATMREFVWREYGTISDITCWEVTGGASSMLSAMAVLALSADDDTVSADLEAAANAYMWVASAAALLDSYVDQFDDAETGDHNWLRYYPSADASVYRTATLIDRAIHEVAALRHGDRHMVIVTSMLAMYLSSDTARSARLMASTQTFAAHGGAMTRLLIPILRAWRIAYGERAR
jgi:tetraprenyl-beta-curcumene synthase